MATGTFDFESDTIGAAPAGLTPILNTADATWTVQDDGSGGKALRLVKSGTSDSGISIDALGSTSADVEVYAVVRSGSTNGTQVGPAFLMETDTSSSATATAYVAGVLGTSDDIQTIRRVAGVFSSWASYPTFVWTTGSWYAMRLRRAGTDVRVKVWAEGATEPNDWLQTSGSGTSSLTAGHVGILARDTNGNKEIKFLSYGTAGDNAPTSSAGAQLATPTGFTFDAASASRQLDGVWNAVTGAATYDWEVEEDVASVWTAFASGNTASTSFQLTDSDGVAWSTTYRARVRAVPGA